MDDIRAKPTKFVTLKLKLLKRSATQYTTSHADSVGPLTSASINAPSGPGPQNIEPVIPPRSSNMPSAQDTPFPPIRSKSSILIRLGMAGGSGKRHTSGCTGAPLTKTEAGLTSPRSTTRYWVVNHHRLTAMVVTWLNSAKHQQRPHVSLGWWKASGLQPESFPR